MRRALLSATVRTVDPWMVGALAAALALRLAMARGGLWLDEAWSSLMAHQVGSPMGVLVRIHHDNNHYLNSWWLQLVGIDAPPLLARALAIACSVLTILPAAAFARRRSGAAGRWTALFFALSPMLVLLGSEARGYAPVLLAIALLIEQVDPMRAGPMPSGVRIGLIGLLGALSHLLMLPAILITMAWLWIGRDDWRSPRRARSAIAACLPALLAVAAIILVGIASMIATHDRIGFGSVTAFNWTGFGEALVELGGLTLGSAWLAVLGLALCVVRPRPARLDVALWLLLIVALPVAVVIVQPANSQLSRYYLLATPALLWLVADRVSALSARRLGVALGVATALAMVVFDVRMIVSGRGEPDLPVRLVAGARAGRVPLLISATRLEAVVSVAAAEQHVPVFAAGPECTPADDLLIDNVDDSPTPRLDHCGTQWTLSAFRSRPMFSGTGWALYSRAGLPVAGPVGNGPRPARTRPARNARAGVAQG